MKNQVQNDTDTAAYDDQRQPSLLVVPPSGPVTAHALRLHPGEPLMASLRSAADVILARIPPEQCSSVFVMTAVGSLRDATLRLANASKRSMGDEERAGKSTTKSKGNEIRRWQERFEIVSLVGTFSRDGGCHLHISLSDAEGKTIGGHLIDGVVFTTAEVVLGTAEGISFVRKLDDKTGYRELIPLQLRREDHSSWWRWGGHVATALLVGVAIGSILQIRR